MPKSVGCRLGRTGNSSEGRASGSSPVSQGTFGRPPPLAPPRPPRPPPRPPLDIAAVTGTSPECEGLWRQRKRVMPVTIKFLELKDGVGAAAHRRQQKMVGAELVRRDALCPACLTASSPRVVLSGRNTQATASAKEHKELINPV